MGKWRAWLWPVRAHELGKFLPLFFMKLFASLNFSVLATVKDTVIVTGTGGGAEVIPVLKGGVVIIFAFLTMLAYTKLSNHISRRNVFYVMLTPFLFFFLFYGFVLYPHQEALSPTTSADWLLAQLGTQHQHWVAVYRYWMHSMFFVVAEIWGGVVIGLLFWGFVNQITNVKDAARFYVLYATGGHVGALISGALVFSCTSMLRAHDYGLIINILMLVVSIVCCMIIALYWYANRNLAVDYKLKEKSNLALKDSLMYIARSPYLGLIALMVIGYGLSVNLVEVTWKSLVKLQYPDPNAYQTFMSMIQFVLGTTSMILAIAFSGGIMRKFGWYLTAQCTPIVLGLCSLAFFVLYFLFPDLHSTTVTIFSLTPLMLLVICGAVHNIACKSMKYCFFDTTKEMAYIPLDNEAKTKGKAAVDLVGARFGKTGSSWIQILLIDGIGSGSILAVVPLLMPVVLVVVGLWIKAVHGLNKRFTDVQQQPEAAAQFEIT
ncbi:MAG TPA: Npt1/Npt2 family nucleotide transporter [Gammaproteobacteria bacterium]|nr:Npt1/Npt2 family nucleotide transporter [Gammaproteobacteria bacterium]